MTKYYIGKNNGMRYEAELFDMNISFQLQRVVLVLSCFRIDPEGNKIQGEVIKPYPRLLIADNTTGVNPLTGEYVEPVTINPESEVQNIVIIGGKAYPEGTVGEFDFFLNIGNNIPIVVKEFIQASILKNRARLMPDGLLPEPEED